MEMLNAMFDGLFAYELMMLICGAVLLGFATILISAMVLQKRSCLPATALMAIAVSLMLIPGINALRFGHELSILDALRSQPFVALDAMQKQQFTAAIAAVEKRSGNNLRLRAQVADGYRLVGSVEKGYVIAQSVLRERPSREVQAMLVPVLTAQLENVTPRDSQATPSSNVQKQQLSTVIDQLATKVEAAQLRATDLLAMARANMVLGRKVEAEANLEAARRLNPGIAISPMLEKALRSPTGTRSAQVLGASG
ncbi:hypothetical protein [Lysobacter fragariae]